MNSCKIQQRELWHSNKVLMEIRHGSMVQSLIPGMKHEKHAMRDSLNCCFVGSKNINGLKNLLEPCRFRHQVRMIWRASITPCKLAFANLKRPVHQRHHRSNKISTLAFAADARDYERSPSKKSPSPTSLVKCLRNHLISKFSLVIASQSWVKMEQESLTSSA
ncbi:unannotated protein [freshwater metagenome]|uniref:Unannotated protein n=1 Tax=freshwater metagenome TaxID=449393 RepID=A0A6J6FI28_9ZZZZ